MYEDIAAYCQRCVICARSKAQHVGHALQSLGWAGLSIPSQLIAIDIIGPLPRTQRQAQYALTIVDYGSRYVVCVPLTGTDSERIAKGLLNHWILPFGTPIQILSDQGANLTSQLLHDLYGSMNISWITSTPYHAQGNALVERMNGTIKQALTCLVNANRTD